jgi:phosphatidate cytidylyltransferase
MFIGTWASDSFAYFVGSALGRHKLCPSISPNKTIEGAVGAVVGTTLTIAALGSFFGWPLPLMAVLGALIAVIATLGDLVESVAKRETGIKDSGNIIPGHGGVWDRFDSVLFTAPLVYYFSMAYYLLTH